MVNILTLLTKGDGGRKGGGEDRLLQDAEVDELVEERKGRRRRKKTKNKDSNAEKDAKEESEAFHSPPTGHNMLLLLQELLQPSSQKNKCG